MRKGLLIALLAVGAMLVGGFLIFSAREEGPRYGGRSLAQWVVLCRYGETARGPLHDGDNPTEREAAVDAIQHIGSDAVPWLLKWIQYEQPTWKRNIEEFKNSKNGLAWITVDRAEVLASCVPAAFAVLRTEGNAAVPELTKLLKKPVEKRSSSRAILALGYLGSDALEPLMAASTNGSRAFRRCALYSLGNLGTNARPAIPLLMQYFRDQDETLACDAAIALGQIKDAPELIVPFLRGALEGPRRGYAAVALGELGERSRLAIPKLLELCDDPDEYVRRQATDATRKIAPDEVLKHPQRQ